MVDHPKTEEQLLSELENLRIKIAELEASEVKHHNIENALRKSEESVRFLCEHAHLSHQSLDEEGRLLEVNNSWLDLLGYSREEVIGKCLEDFVAPESQEQFKNRFAILKATGVLDGVKFEMLRKDGAKIVMVCDGQISHDVSARFKQAYLIFQDVTQMKQLQKSQMETEARYKSLFQNVSDGVAVYKAINDGEDFVFVEFNKAAEIITGFSYSEVIGKKVSDVFPSVKDIGLLDMFHDVWRSGKAANHPASRYVDSTIQIWVDNHVSKLPSGEIIVVFRDITNQKVAEESLRDSTDLLKILVDSLPVGILYVDAAERIILANNTFASWWGKPGADLSGCTVKDTLRDHYTVIKNDISVVLAGKEVSYERTVSYRDGVTRDIAASYIPHIGTDGEIKGFACLIMDISPLKRIQRDLQFEREQLLSIFDAINAVINIIDPATHELLYMNKYAKTLVGHDATGEPCYLVYYGCESPCEHCNNEIVMNRRDEPYHWEYHNKLFDRDFVTTNRTIKWPDGRDVKLEFSTDITERKHSEDALRLSEKKYSDLYNDAPIAYFSIGMDGTILRANRRAGELLGIQWEELAGKRILDFYSDTPEGKAKARGVLGRFKTGENISNEELQMQNISGNTFWISLTVNAVRDKSGAVIESRSMVVDITNRKLAEQTLMESEAQKQAILDGISSNIAFVNKDLEIQWANKTASDSAGKSPSQIIGRKCHELWAYPDKPCDGCPTVKAFKTKKSEHAELVTPDGRVWDEKGEPVFDPEGSLIGVVEIAQDITDRVKADTERESLRSQLFQSQKLEALGTLVGGISHDFNNMLQIILGYSQLLLTGKTPDDPDYEDLQRIISTAEQEADLVKRLLIFARQSGADKVPVDLNVQVKEMSTILFRTFPKMIDMELDLFDGIHAVMADRGQINQIIMNLAINAREAMPDGGKLRVQTKNVTLDNEYVKSHVGLKPGNYVTLFVSDTGRGMDGWTLSRMFEPFFSTKQRGSERGTGLGLSVVKGIVEEHGGHIACESAPEKGTVFTVFFPVADFNKKTDLPSGKSSETGGTETILLVEDEPLLANFAERILSKAGYTVITASNGRKAAEVYQARKDEISLVILDLIMPEMSGTDCLKELIRIDPSVKVIVATGFSVDETIQEEICPYIRGIVQKPYRISELSMAVFQALNSSAEFPE
jgi:two-component system, cell cycle sensor histidine kinase and response regulator CckA